MPLCPMKVILTIDMDDAQLKEEGVDPHDLLKEFLELKEELSEQAGPGITVTLRLEA